MEKPVEKENLLSQENEEKTTIQSEIAPTATATLVEEKEKTKSNSESENSFKQEKTNSSKKHSKIGLIIFALIILLVVVIFSVIFSILNMNKDTIISGVTINNIDVSNMTKSEAISALTDLIDTKKDSKIELSYSPTEDTPSLEADDEDESTKDSEIYETTLDFKSLDIEYDITSAVDEAYNLGRVGNIIENNYKILGTLITKKNFDIKINIDEEALNKTISDISANLPNKLVQNSYFIEDDHLIITKGKSGNIVDSENFTDIFYSTLKNISSSENYIEVPVKNSQPDKIDIDVIHSEIYKEPQDAYYEEEPFKVYSESKGINFDVDKAKSLISENPNESEYTIELKYTDPKITIKDLDIDIFPDLLGSFTTKYDGTNTARTTNLKLAASKINETILSPGEEFSYNAIVGERTIAAGYKEAKVYSNGQVVDGLGGGICQISSTLYNSVVFANLDVTQRYNHQFVTSYVEAGRDATVVYGVKDFKFVNNRKYPIKIVMSVESGVAKAEIYGIKEEQEYDVSFDVETISRIPFSIKYEKDSSLKEGTEKVKQKGANGIIVNVYKVIKQNGKIVSKTLISKDTYNAMQKIILTGTASDKDGEDQKDTNKSDVTDNTDNANANNNTAASNNENNSNVTSSKEENKISDKTETD